MTLLNDLINYLINDLINGLIKDLINDLINDLIKDLINDLINDLTNDLIDRQKTLSLSSISRDAARKDDSDGTNGVQIGANYGHFVTKA